jgi:replicative DNA helicase
MNAPVDTSLMLRQQPFSMVAEQAILGGLLLENGLFDLTDSLAAEDFFFDENRKVYAQIYSQLAAGKPADVVTVWESMPDADRFDLKLLHELCQYVPSAANFRRYAEIVRGHALSRRLMAAGDEIATLAAETERAFDERLEQASGLLNKLQAPEAKDEWITASDGMVLHSQVLEDRAEGRRAAWETGLTDLDEALDGGLTPGALYVIGARPSMGKTAFGMTVGLNMAAHRPVGMLSMEMSHSDLNDRITAMLGHISMAVVKRPGKGMQWDRLIDGCEKAKALQWFASDESNLTINKVRVKARRLKRKHGLDVLIVDYIGLMSGSDPKQPRAYQLEEISRGLKSLAKELGIAVVCLAQVNRKVEERADATPSLSDLRDSGAIEQDADAVIFLHRPVQAKPELGPDWQFYAKASIAKNRQGRSGCVVNLTYIGEQTRFANWSGPAPVSMSRTASKGMRDA